MKVARVCVVLLSVVVLVVWAADSSFAEKPAGQKIRSSTIVHPIERDGDRFVVIGAENFPQAKDWCLQRGTDLYGEPCLIGKGEKPLTVSLNLPAGVYYPLVRSRYYVCYLPDKRRFKRMRKSAAEAMCSLAIDGVKSQTAFGGSLWRPWTANYYKRLNLGRYYGLVGDRSYLDRLDYTSRERGYRWKNGKAIKVAKDGRHVISIARLNPRGPLAARVSGIVLTTKADFRLPEYHVTAKRLKRSLTMDNSLALYKMPLHLHVKPGQRAFRYRSGENFAMVDFRAEGRRARPWEYYSFEGWPKDVFGNDPEFEKKVKAGVRRNLAILREKTTKARNAGKFTIVNMNLMYIPRWASKSLRKLYPQAMGEVNNFCGVSPQAKKLLRCMVSEMFANVPLDGLQLTMGDNGGCWECNNPEHQHFKNFIKRVGDVEKHKILMSGRKSKTPRIYDHEYAEQTFYNILTSAYEGMKQHRKKPILLVRLWGGFDRVMNDDARRDAFLARLYKIIPKEDLFLVCKHGAPPSSDYCWKPAGYSPLFCRPGNTFAILGWGEDQKTKCPFPISIWYDWPNIIQRDLKFLRKQGCNGTMGAGGFGRGGYPEQELSHLATGSLLRDPDLDLDAFKKRWAKYRFGSKAGKHVLEAIEYGPKILEKHTLIHEGPGQYQSIHCMALNGLEWSRISRTPSWLKTVDESNYRKLRKRLDATPQAKAMLREIKIAHKLRPNDEMIEYYCWKARATLHLANWFRNYHHAYLHFRMYQNLREKNRKMAIGHVKEALKLYESALIELEKYSAGPPYGLLGCYCHEMRRETDAYVRMLSEIARKEGLVKPLVKPSNVALASNGAVAVVSGAEKGFSADALIDGVDDFFSRWQIADTSAEITITLAQPVKVEFVRIKWFYNNIVGVNFVLYARIGEKWRRISRARGDRREYSRMKFKPVTTKKLRLVINKPAPIIAIREIKVFAARKNRE